MAYAQKKGVSPGGLTAAIAVNAVVLAGLFTAGPDIIRNVEKILTIENIPVDPPETVPLDPPPQPRTDTKVKPVERKPIEIVPIVDTAANKGPVIELGRDPVIDLGPIGVPGGTDIGPVVEQPPAPPPPLIGARRDPNYEGVLQPDYPTSKLRMEEEGRVTVRVLVGADGRVKQVEPVGSPDPAFLAATRKQALARWRFKPATRGGVAEEQWITQSVTFTITNR